MQAIERALEDFIKIFENQGIAYAVMGGLAVRVHGIPRPTHDVDFTISVDRNALPACLKAIEQSGYTVPEMYWTGWVDRVADLPLIKFRSYLDGGHGVDIDVFLAESPFQKSVILRRQPLEVDGTKSWIVSPEDLILLKLIANRPRDLSDIGDILFTQGSLDTEYLRLWATNLGIAERLDFVLSNPPL